LAMAMVPNIKQQYIYLWMLLKYTPAQY